MIRENTRTLSIVMYILFLLLFGMNEEDWNKLILLLC